MRIEKLLSHMGLGTRSEIKKDLVRGFVSVNGVVVKKSGFNVNEMSDQIVYKGNSIKYEPYVYLMLNKPKGYISATEDPKHKTVIDIFKEEYGNRKLFPVGRLDIDTEGLLLITDDGDFSHSLMAPHKHVKKTYYAEIEGEVLEKHISEFLDGIVLEDGYICKPAGLEIVTSGEISKVLITITEGKFHQVKRMFQAIHTEVVYLKRTQIGGLALDESLPLMGYKTLSEDEIKKIKP